jgi:Cu/Ag efflux protein CusF
MKKAVTIVVSFFFALSVLSISFAAEKVAEQKGTIPAKAEEKATATQAPAIVKQVTGDVKGVDTKAKTITITKGQGDKLVETVLVVDDKTKIMSGKEQKKFADVKAGDKVRVKYSEVDGKNMAKRIQVIPLIAKAPAEKSAETAKPAEKK